MERIQKALEQATLERQKAGQVAKKQRPAAAVQPADPGANATAADASQVRYTRTKVIEVSDKLLYDNRIVAALPQHELQDAYRMLRTRVLQTMRAGNMKSLAVTGPTAGCGKTLTAINLAVSLAMEVTQTVLLVDLDLRSPSIHEYFGYEPEFGIGDYLQRDVPVEDILFSPSIDRLVVLPGREPIHNSSEMLRSPKALKLVEEIQGRYPDRLVVVDLPPILAADDALAFSPHIDAMLLVAEDGGTRREDLERALEMLKKSEIIGTVLNKASAVKAGYGYHPVKNKKGERRA